MVTVKNYLGFVGHMIVAFGVAFELPLILAFLAKIGIASPEYLRQNGVAARHHYHPGGRGLDDPAGYSVDADTGRSIDDLV